MWNTHALPLLPRPHRCALSIRPTAVRCLLSIVLTQHTQNSFEKRHTLYYKCGVRLSFPPVCFTTSAGGKQKRTKKEKKKVFGSRPFVGLAFFRVVCAFVAPPTTHIQTDSGRPLAHTRRQQENDAKPPRPPTSTANTYTCALPVLAVAVLQPPPARLQVLPWWILN